MKSGILALIASLILILWVVLAAYLAILSATYDVAGVIATILFFASWVVVPLLVIGVLVFGVIALLLNPVPGKILGALGIALPFVVAALFWNSLFGMTNPFDLL